LIAFPQKFSEIHHQPIFPWKITDISTQVLAPTSDLVQQIAEVARVAASRSRRGFQV
jgi:hypothetical protein